MALNSSGAISLAGTTTGQSVAVELSQSATGQISLNDTNVRTLAAVASGAIVMPTNFWGKSSFAGVTGIYMTLAKGGGANKIAYGNNYVIAGTQTLSNLIYYSSDNGQTWGTIAFPINYNILSVFADANAWYFIVRIQTSSSAFTHSTYRCPFASTITTVNNWVDTLTDTYYRTTLINNIWIYSLFGNITSLSYKTAYNNTWAFCNVGSPVANYLFYNYGQGGQPTKYTDIASNGSNLLMMGKVDSGGTSTVYVLISTDNGANWTETNTGITVNSTYGIYVYNVQFDTVSNKFYAVLQHSTNGGELRLVSTTSSGTSWTLYDATAIYFNQPIKLINDGTNPYWIGGSNRIQKCPANSTGAYTIIYDNITDLRAIVKTGSNYVTVGEGSFAGTGNLQANTWFSTTSGQPFQYVWAYWGNQQSYLTNSSIGFFSAFAGYYNTGSLGAGIGVHFSNNNGSSWSTYTFDGDVGQAGVVASNTAAVLYTGTGTYRRSTDGTTWSAVTLPSSDRSRTVIALGSSSGLMISYGYNVGGYAYSTNSGASWTNSSIGAGYTILVGCAIGATITLFSYDASGIMYYHKTTNGTSWTTAAIGGGLGTYLNWEGITALPTSVIVITAGYSTKIWVSTDGGINFTEYTCNTGVYGFFNQQLCYGGNIKLCSDGTYFVGIAYTDTGYQTRSIYKSTDGLNYTKGGCGNAQIINLAGVLYKTGETPSLTNCNYVAAYGDGGNKPQVTAVGYLTS